MNLTIIFEEEEVANPIRPEEVVERRKNFIPDGVIEAFNESIVENWNGKSSTVRQDHVVNRIAEKLDIYDRTQVIDRHYLDIEDIFHDAGWKVTYDKPGYNETYPATFEFRKK